jgi:hypothetical protein
MTLRGTSGHPPLIDRSDRCSVVELETRKLLASFRNRISRHTLSSSPGTA